MAKGQQKSNREVRKPKKAASEKIKTAPAATNIFAKPGSKKPSGMR
jgi:hypothetical protein